MKITNVVNSHEALTDMLKLSNMFDADHKCFVRRRQCNSERKEVTRHDSPKWRKGDVPLDSEAMSVSKIFNNSFNKIYRTFIFCIMDIYYTIEKEYQLKNSM